MNIQILAASLWMFYSLSAFAQNAQNEVLNDITFLADDRLEGRATGSKGEEIAAQYIASRYASIGLKPAGEYAGYFQVFEVAAGRLPGSNNLLIAGGKQIPVKPLFLSGNALLEGAVVDAGYGIVAPELNHDDYAGKTIEGKLVLIQLSTPEGTHPHTPFYGHADERIKVETAINKGAVGVIFYCSDTLYDTGLLTDYTHRTEAVNIPVILLDNARDADMVRHAGTVKIGAELHENRKTGKNVAGLLDKGSDCTVIIGAHYDHLGYGESGGSLYRGEAAIHNGADDNASGVALMLELANRLSNQDHLQYNYLFVAFSGEELGLHGSKSMAQFLVTPNNCYNYMLNFDMVGRLDSSRNLVVNGYGTSSAWTILPSLAQAQQLQLKTYESGIGPSDHTSFYLKEIPVLHFFTGSHADYHKPSDDVEKINLEGIETLSHFVEALMLSLDDDARIDYIKTKEENNDNAPRFSVTLGVIPDYTYEGRGMRIDGVSEGKPAALSGLQAGDVITGLGNSEVVDMMSYMKALSLFKKGDQTIVIYRRNEEIKEANVQF